eukprot:scaffold429_cov269-Pinguiococcus_pyrenoidosus.AAC.25
MWSLSVDLPPQGHFPVVVPLVRLLRRDLVLGVEQMINGDGREVHKGRICVPADSDSGIAQLRVSFQAPLSLQFVALVLGTHPIDENHVEVRTDFLAQSPLRTQLLRAPA